MMTVFTNEVSIILCTCYAFIIHICLRQTSDIIILSKFISSSHNSFLQLCPVQSVQRHNNIPMESAYLCTGLQQHLINKSKQIFLTNVIILLIISLTGQKKKTKNSNFFQLFMAGHLSLTCKLHLCFTCNLSLHITTAFHQQFTCTQ